MKLVIPMSGEGSRFKAVGYIEPKPLIVVEGKPIIAHVLDMFPGLDDVIFICSEEHLAKTNLREVLKNLRPNCEIISIPSKKLGPVHALTFALPYLEDNEDVMISYCDFTQKWNFADFKKRLGQDNFAGAVPAYTGFHPHLLHKNLYAGILTDSEQFMTAIEEKHCFTTNPEDSHHSSGIYYFGSGALLKKYIAEIIEDEKTLNGEYYVSMLYPYLLRDKLKVYVPSISHFRQWGTPEDLEEYEAWSRLIHRDLNMTKPITHIPKEREPLVQILYPQESPEYKNCYRYWQEVLR